MGSLIKRYLTVENATFTLVCIAAVFSSSSLMTDTSLVPKQLFTIVAVSILIIALCIKNITGFKVRIDSSAWRTIIAMTAGIEAAYALFQFLIYSYFHLNVIISGHFDNPAGLMAMLCLSLPFALYNCSPDAKHRKIAIAITLLIISAIFVSRSRTGILITVLLLLEMFLRYRKLELKRRLILLSAIMILLIAGAYFINRDSADGRILIWRACWPLICDTPLWGNGSGAFLRLYMDYQAAFLENYPPDSNYAMLADNVLVPFNEYINLYLNYGAIGLLTLIGIATAVIVCYRRKPDPFKRAALYTLVILAFISLFSYPFTYPFTYIATAFCIYVICKGDLKLRISRFRQITCALICAAFFVLICVNTIRQIENEYLWGEAYSKNDVVKYEHLMKKVFDFPFFLYSYSMFCYDNQEYQQSLNLALKCDSHLSHYDIKLLLGDIYLKINDFNNAERNYIKALHMCPNRFAPMESLHEVYLKSGQHEKANQIANAIIAKPVKVDSRQIKVIKYRMKQYLNIKS